MAATTGCAGDPGAACPVLVPVPVGRRAGECAPVWGSATTRGLRRAMEDASAAVPLFADVPVRMLASARELDALGRVGVDAFAARPGMHLFGVYDGHGGSEVANYCGDRIHVALREALSRAEGSSKGELELELGIQDVWEKAFSECFKTVDDEVSGEASRSMSAADGGGVSEARREAVAAGNVGSTAVVALVCSSHVIVANCGDSRAVLCRGKKPMALSVDHKPGRIDERARIEAAGGVIINWHGYRVAGVLAVSRAIGDRDIKPFIIPKPEVRVIPRAKDDDCLILASDGLWDVISNEDACKVARLKILMWHRENDGTDLSFGGGNGEEEEEPTTISDPASQAAADYLVKLALFKGSYDNITVTVIDLKRRKMVRDTRQRQRNAGHPHEEARGGSEGAAGPLGVVVVLGTGGDGGVEESRGP